MSFLLATFSPSLAVLISAALLLMVCLLSRALSADTQLTEVFGTDEDLPVLANAVIYRGSGVGLSGGYGRALVAGDPFGGHAIAPVTGTAANGGALVTVRTGVYRLKVTLSGVAVTDVRKPVYMSDDCTYTLTPAGNSFVGRVIRYVTTDTAIVEFYALPCVPSALLYVATAASTAISNTAAETVFDINYTLPANSLKVGDVLRIRYQGIATGTNGADTLLIKFYIGGLTGTALLVGTATDVANNNVFAGEVTITIRTIGANGTFVAVGTHTEAPAASGTASQATVEITASTAIDTTAAQQLTAAATWSAANAGNSVRLDAFTVERLRKAA